MISFDQFQRESPQPSRANYDAMLRLARQLDIDFETYAEFKEKCLASFELYGELWGSDE